MLSSALAIAVTATLIAGIIAFLYIFRRRIILYSVNRSFDHDVLLKAAYKHPSLFRFTVASSKIPTTLKEVTKERKTFSEDCQDIISKSPPVELKAVENITIKVSDRTLIKTRVYVPKSHNHSECSSTSIGSACGDEDLPALIYLHGGGWCYGDLDSYDLISRTIANVCNCMVFAIQYRLAPEHRYPIPLKDCYDCTKWIINEQKRFRYRKDSVFIAGDSTGGTLAAALILKMQKEAYKEFKSIKGQILFYPVTSYDFTKPSYKNHGNGEYIMTTKLIKQFWKHYLPEKEQNPGKTSPLESPLISNLLGMPPSLITAAQFDPLQDDAVLYAEKLLKAGGIVQFLSYATMHGYIQYCSSLDYSLDTFKKMKSFVKTFSGIVDCPKCNKKKEKEQEKEQELAKARGIDEQVEQIEEVLYE